MIRVLAEGLFRSFLHFIASGVLLLCHSTVCQGLLFSNSVLEQQRCQELQALFCLGNAARCGVQQQQRISGMCSQVWLRAG
jgi:hypothetical protein